MIALFITLCAVGTWVALISLSHFSCMDDTDKALKRLDRRLDQLLEKPKKDPQPICGCSHHLAFHKEGEGCKQVNQSWVQKDGLPVELPPRKPRPVLAIPATTKDNVLPQLLALSEHERDLKAWQAQEELRLQQKREWRSVTTPCPCQGYIGPEYYPVVLP